MTSLGKKNAWTHESKVIPVPHGYIIQTQKMSSLPMTWLFFFFLSLSFAIWKRRGSIRITSLGIKSTKYGRRRKDPSPRNQSVVTIFMCVCVDYYTCSCVSASPFLGCFLCPTY
uniref:Uncharacterized protein n=1 Tax=Daphnia magna TaxID=35525 RepID=A0A0P6B112_9CRUS